MAVTEAISISINAGNAITPGGASGAGQAGKSFGEWLTKPENQVRINEVVGTEAHQIIQKTARKIEGGARLSTRDLLLYQIRIHRFAARVELVSKAVESGMAAVRRFQNGG